MKNLNFEELISKIINGTASEQEVRIYHSWYEKMLAHNDQEENEVQEIVEGDFSKVLIDRIHEKIDLNYEVTPVSRSVFSLKKIVVAASLLFFIGLGVLWYISDNKDNIDLKEQNICAARENFGAVVLKLSDGTFVNLNQTNDDTKFTQSEVDIKEVLSSFDDTKGNSSIKPNEYHSLITAYGQKFNFILPDGSKVWMNAGTILKFPKEFSLTERRVELIGEAFFDVVKNTAKPFVVESNGQEVMVTGTRFNIESYSEDNFVKTTLVSGGVIVKNMFTGNTTRINPGEVLTFENNVMKISNKNSEESIAWMNNLFIFNNQSLASITKKLVRWYDVEIVYTDENKLKMEMFSGVIQRSESIEDVLDVLAMTGALKYKIEGRRVILMF